MADMQNRPEPLNGLDINKSSVGRHWAYGGRSEWVCDFELSESSGWTS